MTHARKLKAGEDELDRKQAELENVISVLEAQLRARNGNKTLDRQLQSSIDRIRTIYNEQETRIHLLHRNILPQYLKLYQTRTPGWEFFRYGRSTGALESACADNDVAGSGDRKRRRCNKG